MELQRKESSEPTRQDLNHQEIYGNEQPVNVNNSIQTITITDHKIHECHICKRKLKSVSGLKNHLRKCNENNVLKANSSEPPPSAEANISNEPNDSSNATFEPEYINLDMNFNELNLYHTQIDSAFEKIVKWKKNLFDLPKSAC